MYIAESSCTVLSAENIEPIEVVTHRGFTFAYDGNRRLYVYKKLRSLDVNERKPTLVLLRIVLRG